MHTSTLRSFGFTRLAAAGLAVTAWIGISLPSQAANIPTSTNRNQYRSCADRLLGAGVSAEAAANACAGALYPQDIGRCVARIEQRTEITAEDAVATCTQVRRPIEVARCVVGISTNTPGQPIPGVLDYCGRSLLPVNFAECVVGLRREINLAPDRALETCISASDRPLEFSPNFIPKGQTAPAQPTLPTAPQTAPTEPAPTTEPQQTAPTEPAPTTEPQQTTPTEPAPTTEPQQTTPTEPAPSTP